MSREELKALANDIEKEIDWRLLTIPEASAYLQKSVKTVREGLRTGKLQGLKVGGMWRIREGDLRAFLDAAEPRKEGL